MSGTATVGGSVVVAVVVGGAGGGDGGSASADDEVAVGVGQGGSLDALRLASRVSAVVLALFVRLEVVGVALTARVDELLAVARLCVEPPPIAVRAAVALFNYS